MATNSIQKSQSYWRSLYKGDMEIPFSERLLSILCYHTDVGQIPRSNARTLSPASSHCNDINWKKAITGCYWYVNWRVGIEGCYWCGKATNPNPCTYVCDKKCYQYLHEWCRRKLSEFGEYLCVYPGCDVLVVRDVKFCSEAHLNKLEKNFKTIHNVSTGKIVLKIPDWYKQDNPRLYKQQQQRGINRMAEKLTSSFNINGKDFEKEASEIKNKIQTYFSQLIVTIKNRQIKLITEVDEILSRYRKEKDRVRKKMRELEEMKKYHEELYSTSTFKNLQDDILKRIKTELAAMNQETMDSMVIEFEWNKKFVTEAKELGTLETYSIFSLCTNDTYEELCNMVTSNPPAQCTPPVFEANSQFMQQSEVNFNLVKVKTDQDNSTRHQSCASEWVTDEHQSPLMNNPCTHGTFGKSHSYDSSDPLRPHPSNPDYQQSTNLPSESLRNQTDNSESIDVILPQKQNPFGKS